MSEELVDAADLVVGLTASHAMQLMLSFPHAAAKITSFPMEISDPYGGDEKTYLDCAEQIRLGIELAFFGGDG